MSETIIPLDLGFLPEAAVSGASVLQSEYSCFLLFNAIREDDDLYVDAGLAIIEFKGCSVTQFGYPNDEAWSRIPRTRGLSYGCYEVLNSEWTNELTRLNRHGFPDTPDSKQRHFLFLFHDSSFECVASGLQATLSHEPFLNTHASLSKRIAAE